jgi:acetoin utilization deacetylase AcuC-like enzyme
MLRQPLVCYTTPGHHRHQVRDRGYLETPRRIDALARGIEELGLEIRPPRRFAERHLKAVHDEHLIRFLRDGSASCGPDQREYPYLFPIRNVDRPPKDWTLAVGYHCLDTFTPVHRFAYDTARTAVDAALSAAEAVRRGARLAYALVRPPGHHAERSVFGGFCYFNNSAVAANYLSRWGRVAMLDVDYHHGNGQQNIFWERDDVLTLSIHAEPSIAYPYFAGFAHEKGAGRGLGCNVNLPLGEVQNGADYRRALGRALAIVREFQPDFLVVPLGLDTARGDPTGSFLLDAADFEVNGRLIAGLGLPTLFVQEGGYRMRTLGRNLRRFFKGVLDGADG